jgi:hypothetical protein
MATSIVLVAAPSLATMSFSSAGVVLGANRTVVVPEVVVVVVVDFFLVDFAFVVFFAVLVFVVVVFFVFLEVDVAAPMAVPLVARRASTRRALTGRVIPVPLLTAPQWRLRDRV